jgi:hypothetical protein
MSDSTPDNTVDMSRWTFDAKPENKDEIAAYLTEQGLDFAVSGEAQFHVIWDEPDRDLNEVATELWDLNEEPFEITQEDFRRVGNFLIQPDEAEGEDAQAA